MPHLHAQLFLMKSKPNVTRASESLIKEWDQNREKKKVKYKSSKQKWSLYSDRLECIYGAGEKDQWLGEVTCSYRGSGFNSQHSHLQFQHPALSHRHTCRQNIRAYKHKSKLKKNAFTKHKMLLIKNFKKMNSWKLSYPGRMKKSRERLEVEKIFPQKCVCERHLEK